MLEKGRQFVSFASFFGNLVATGGLAPIIVDNPFRSKAMGYIAAPQHLLPILTSLGSVTTSTVYDCCSWLTFSERNEENALAARPTDFTQSCLFSCAGQIPPGTPPMQHSRTKADGLLDVGARSYSQRALKG